jgi:LmbE family N-acetylglucosaminyl deacetylase
VKRLVIVAPHPDDEVLGCASLLGARCVAIVHITDGVPPWASTDDQPGLREIRIAECHEAWAAVECDVESHITLGYPDLGAWRVVEDIGHSLTRVLREVGPAKVYVPAYQRGHPDHDAVFVAALRSRELLRGVDLDWFVYGLYGFDYERQLRFGWMDPKVFKDVVIHSASEADIQTKASAMRQFTSQIWPGSMLDRWLAAPQDERFASLPDLLDFLPRVPSFYGEALDFDRYGATESAVMSALIRALELLSD